MIPINDSNCPKDERIEKILQGYKEQTDQKYNKILCKMTKDLTHPNREEETEVGNLFADILREQLGVDMMLVGTGSLRKELFESIVTLGSLREMYPYGAGTFSLKMKGKELEKMIHHIYSTRFAGNGEEFFARSKGMSISYDMKNKEIISIHFHGQALDPDKTYLLGLQKFHLDNAKSNLGFDPSELEIEQSARSICTNELDLLEEYFLAHQELSAEIEGRLIFIN